MADFDSRLASASNPEAQRSIMARPSCDAARNELLSCRPKRDKQDDWVKQTSVSKPRAGASGCALMLGEREKRLVEASLVDHWARLGEIAGDTTQSASARRLARIERSLTSSVLRRLRATHA